LDADDVAILDIHIFRAGILAGFFSSGMTVDRHYFELEDKFLEVAAALNVSAAELDAVIWHEMQQSRSVHFLLKNRFKSISGKGLDNVPNQRETHSHEFALA
jgi:hypothetical protein